MDSRRQSAMSRRPWRRPPSHGGARTRRRGGQAVEEARKRRSTARQDRRPDDSGKVATTPPSCRRQVNAGRVHEGSEPVGVASRRWQGGVERGPPGWRPGGLRHPPEGASPVEPKSRRRSACASPAPTRRHPRADARPGRRGVCSGEEPGTDLPLGRLGPLPGWRHADLRPIWAPGSL